MNILSWRSYLCPFKWPLHIWEIAIHIFKILCRLLTQDLWTDTFLHTELRSYTNDIIKIDNFVNWHLNLHVVMYKNNNKNRHVALFLKVGGGWGWGGGGGRLNQSILTTKKEWINSSYVDLRKTFAAKKVPPLPSDVRPWKGIYCFVSKSVGLDTNS